MSSTLADYKLEFEDVPFIKTPKIRVGKDMKMSKQKSVEATPAKAYNKTKGVQVGDIFMANWGYDETHIDYVKVVSIKGRRAIFEDLTGTPGFSGVGDKRTKLIQGNGDNAYISLTSYCNGYKTTLEYAQRRREQDDVMYTGNYR